MSRQKKTVLCPLGGVGVGGKWKFWIWYHLLSGTKRFGDVGMGQAGRGLDFFLKPLHQVFALLHLGLSVEGKARASKNRLQEGREGRDDLAELGEDQHLLLAGGDDFGDIAQARPLAAVLLAPRAVAQPLRWMIAYLLESH